MSSLQRSTENTSAALYFLMAVILFIGAGTTTAHAAPLFEEPINYKIGNPLEEVAGAQISDSVLADFDGDGFLDIAGTIPQAVVNSNEIPDPDEGVVILLNDGDGTFTVNDYIAYLEYLTAIVSADFDNDGDADLATVNSNTDDLTILLNDGNGNFTITSRPETGAVPEEMVSADFNGDGDVDLAVTVAEISPENDIQNEPGIQIFLNSGNGDFVLDSSVPTYTPGYTAFADLTEADFDGDGDVDILAGSGNGVAIYSVITNNGNGLFTSSEVTLLSEDPDNAPEFENIASGDIDNDGDIDVVATLANNELLTLINDGTSLFTPSLSAYVGNMVSGTLSDFDSDGDLDLITSAVGINEIHLLTNDGTGVLVSTSDPISIPLGDSISISVGDLNNDDNIDFAVSSLEESGIWVVLQTYTGEPTPTEQAASLILDVVDLDLPNNLENSYLANLYKVEGFIGSGLITPAINQLNAFINKVNQDYNQGKITQQVRDDLVASAQNLIDDLTN